MFNVSLQRQYPDGDLVVEVGRGDINYANPGAISDIKEFDDPREAVECAIVLAQIEEAGRKEIVEVAYGYTAGYTMPFSPCTPEELIEWAENWYEKLPKCSQCGDIISERPYRHEMADEDLFCSSNCVSVWEQAQYSYCPAHEDYVFQDDTVADHRVCWSCHHEMLAGDRCRMCLEYGHDSSHCLDNPERLTDWVVRVYQGERVVACWDIYESTKADALLETAEKVAEVDAYDEWDMEEIDGD